SCAVAPARIAESAAAAGVDAHAVARLELHRVLEGVPRGAVGRLDGDVARLRVVAAVHAPGWALGALEPGRHAAVRQQEIAPRPPAPAAVFAGTARVGAQLAALDHERVCRLVHLDRDHAGVAVAHGAERPGPVLAGQRAPAAEAAVVALPERAA